MRALSIALLVLLSGCAGSGWDGRRGYDGNGDYGYDLNASRAEAHAYRARASRSYPVPGTQDDPWGPYVREAASRYAVPERWIREVMRQESGGRLQSAGGSLTTSPVGAMGLMQVMPGTYDMLRRRYGLGDDPYEPHDNVMAGAAYIREMSDRFGSPAFLAAYNAGPDRVDAYLAGTAGLPDETVNYLAQVAPRLGSEVAMTGTPAAYAGNGIAVAGVPSAYAAEDAADRAYDGGGLVTGAAPTGILSGTGQSEPGGYGAFRPAVSPVSMLVPAAAAPAAGPGLWAIQVGAFPDPAISRTAVAAARSQAGGLLAGLQPAVTPVEHDGATLYRARLVGLTPGEAAAACTVLARGGTPCFTVPPGS
jgi:D-alanyl-D-alanine carboxypeptidase